MKPVTGRRMCKVLEAHGWVLGRINGSHHNYTRPGSPLVIPVPVHGNRDLARGTQRAIMRQAGLTDDHL